MFIILPKNELFNPPGNLLYYANIDLSLLNLKGK